MPGGPGVGRGCACASSRKLQTFLFLRDKAASPLHHPVWSRGRGGQETGWQWQEEPGGLCSPPGLAPLGKAGSSGTCKRGGGVKTRHRPKALCQLPGSEGERHHSLLILRSLHISVPANDFLGCVILALSKFVMKY